MPTQLPIKISSGKRKRMVSGTDFIPEGAGGTGQVAYSQGDILQGAGGGGLAKLPVGTAGQVLTVSGSAAAWQTPASPSTITDTLTNDEATALTIGMAVYSDAAGGCKKAKADSATTSSVVGLALNAASAGGSAIVQLEGDVVLTTGQWDAVAGTTGGLTFGASYYLSAGTAGSFTATAPDTTGQEVTYIGVGLAPTKMRLSIRPPISA